MNFKKTLLIFLALVLTLSFASCQLSEYMDKETDTGADTSADTSADTEALTLEDFIPEGVDVNYRMDYMSEDLTAYLTLGEYKGLSVNVSTYEVNDEYIDEKINELLES